jgi:hypothetical protein
VKESGIAFSPRRLSFYHQNRTMKFLAGSSVCLSRLICSKGSMKRMSAELPLSMRMLCIVNLAIFTFATKASVCRKSRTWKSFSSKVIGTID